MILELAIVGVTALPTLSLSSDLNEEFQIDHLISVELESNHRFHSIEEHRFSQEFTLTRNSVCNPRVEVCE